MRGPATVLLYDITPSRFRSLAAALSAIAGGAAGILGALAAAALFGINPALPFLVGGFIWITNPNYLAPLVGEPAGRVILLMAGIFMNIGIIILKRMVSIKV